MNIAKRHVRAIYFEQMDNNFNDKTKIYRYDVCHDGKGNPLYITKQATTNYYATLGLKQPLFIRKDDIIYLSKKEQRNLISAISAVIPLDRKVESIK